MITWRYATTFILWLASCHCAAGKVSAAVAANFAGAMTIIAREFETASGHEVTLSFGSSGKFFAQIKNGAPYDVFFSADQVKPRALQQAGLVVPGSRFTYAIGALALWSANATLIDARAQVLKQGHFKRLAIANPTLAPYGVAAMQVLHNLGIAAATHDKLVRGENVAQAYQFAHSGNAELGFVALSQVWHEREGSHWIVPPHLYAPIRQDAVLLRRAENNRAARALLRFARSDRVKRLLASRGYRAEAEI